MAKNNKLKPYDLHEFKKKNVHNHLVQKGKEIGEKLSYKDISHFEIEKRNVFDILKIRENLLVKELLPLKYEKMSQDTFSFFRGTADVMTYDLDRSPSSGIEIIICGDAHLGNFGFYSSPERQLLFDINDFDESKLSYWEYDLKRFLVSALLVANNQSFSKNKTRTLLIESIDLYLSTLKTMKVLPAIERLLYPNTVKNITSVFSDKTSDENNRLIKKSIKKAKEKDSNSAVKKYTKLNKNNERQFIQNPPNTKKISKQDYIDLMVGYTSYVEKSRSDIQLFLSQCTVIDIVRHSVGVGSVGTLCYLVLLKNLDGTYLVLQIKEALPIYNEKSVYSTVGDQGQNIIDYQHILQSASDPFLGAFKLKNKHFYVRQFRDMKGSIKLNKLDWETYCGYVNTCIVLMARAHSQSQTFPKIIGFLESHDWMAESFVDFSETYLEQVNLDYQNFLEKAVVNMEGK